MSPRLQTARSRMDFFESLYRSIERGETLHEFAVNEDSTFLAGVHTDSRDSSVVYAERLDDSNYFAILLKPSYSKRLPNPTEHLHNPGKMPERLTHCTGRGIRGDLHLEEIRSPRELREAALRIIRAGGAEITESYQTIHTRGQLGQIYHEHVLQPRSAAENL